MQMISMQIIAMHIIAIELAKNPGHHQRPRHIDVRYLDLISEIQNNNVY